MPGDRDRRLLIYADERLGITSMFQRLQDSRAVPLGAVEQFARDSGVSVGRIKTASQGYFSIGARDGEDCDDCSSSGGSSPFQKVRVVTTFDYDLGWRAAARPLTWAAARPS